MAVGENFISSYERPKKQFDKITDLKTVSSKKERQKIRNKKLKQANYSLLSKIEEPNHPEFSLKRTTSEEFIPKPIGRQQIQSDRVSFRTKNQGEGHQLTNDQNTFQLRVQEAVQLDKREETKNEVQKPNMASQILRKSMVIDKESVFGMEARKPQDLAASQSKNKQASLVPSNPDHFAEAKDVESQKAFEQNSFELPKKKNYAYRKSSHKYDSLKLDSEKLNTYHSMVHPSS